MAPSLVPFPQISDYDAHLGEQPANQRQADPHHVRRASLNAGDEPTAEPIQREPTGHPRRLPGTCWGIGVQYAVWQSTSCSWPEDRRLPTFTSSSFALGDGGDREVLSPVRDSCRRR